MKYQAKLGEYLLGRKLGAGQYSKVREGERGGQKYAVKYLKKDADPSLTETYFDLVLNEVKVMSALDHPSLVKLHEYGDKGALQKSSGKTAPVLYMALDLITGGELFDYVAVSGRFSDKMARFYYRQLIEALEYMHSKGFAHRDIKAENVLLDSNYKLKLADFGFSTPIAGKDGSGKLTSYKGTETYMAPELLSYGTYSGEKVDIFATGVLLFIMIAQHSPFRKATAMDGFYKMLCTNSAAYWKKVMSSKPPETFKPELIELLTKLLSPKPDNRPTISEIKASKWYNGPLPIQEEVNEEFKKRRNKVEINWKNQEAAAIAKKAAESGAIHGSGGFAPHGAGATRGAMGEVSEEKREPRILPNYEPVACEQTVLFTVEDPDTIFDKLNEYFNTLEFSVNESSKKYKMEVKCSIEDTPVGIEVKLEKVNENTSCIRVNRIIGSKMDFLETFNELKTYLEDAEVIMT